MRGQFAQNKQYNANYKNMKTTLTYLILLTTLCSCTNDGQTNTITIDLFSIISFALALTSVVFALFMGWLSWELYKKSCESAEKIQQAVIRIEASVLSIKGDITEIVRRAVSYWIDDEAPGQDPATSRSEVTDKLEEISNRIKEMVTVNPKANLIEEKLKEILIVQKQELEKFNSTLFDAKVKNIFPSINTTSAISLYQQALVNTESEKSGQLQIRINRPVKIATATGKFTPQFETDPFLTVKLISSPYKDMSNIHLTSGIGKFSDFHVHLKIPESLLVEGDYVVEYLAKTS
jgi:hypothetical protein